MTDNEIIKALECCFVNGSCNGCPLASPLTQKCLERACHNALVLINRQKQAIADERAKGDICAEVIKRQDKEIERHKKYYFHHEYDKWEAEIRDKAIKEFASALTNKIGFNTDLVDVYDYIDEIIEEMIGGE